MRVNARHRRRSRELLWERRGSGRGSERREPPLAPAVNELARPERGAARNLLGMAMSEASATLHEAPDRLRPETIDRHRAFVSIIEELEAADWYDQRVDAAADEELRQILAHNRDEEKEHAAMLLEWLRRRDEPLDRHLRQYLFQPGSISERAEALEVNQEDGEQAGGRKSDGSLGIGGLRGRASQR
jgi:uncharacterized protein